MSIVQFTKEEFEAALPRHYKTNEPLWIYGGYDHGELVYFIPVNRKEQGLVNIIIRSSIHEDGIAAKTGEDSIRIWLEVMEQEYGSLVRKSLGKGTGSYITRVKGWEERLIAKLREVYGMALKVNRCPVCNKWKKVRIVKRKNKNYGRIFEICDDCKNEGKKDQFEWLTDIDEKIVEKYGV